MKYLLMLLLISISTINARDLSCDYDDPENKGVLCLSLGLGFTTPGLLNMHSGFVLKGSDYGALMTFKGDAFSDISDDLIYSNLSKNPFNDKLAEEVSTYTQLSIGFMMITSKNMYLVPTIGWGSDNTYYKLKDDTGILSNGGDYYYVPIKEKNYFVMGITSMFKFGYLVTSLEIDVPIGRTNSPVLFGFNIGFMIEITN